jgi:Uma2 family endonuclease
VTVEILSPDDRMAEVRRKLEDYLTWGVTHVWLIDPEWRRFYVCSAPGLAEVTVLEIPEIGFRLTPPDLFQ